MNRRHHHRGPHCGPRGRGRFPGNRDEWLARLEEYQRDLEQRTADVADLIRRLKTDPPEAGPAGTATV